VSRLLRSRAAAEYLGIPREDLEDLRCRGEVRAAGYVRVRSALYDTDDLDDFLISTTPHRELTVGRETVTIIYDEETP
jgi:hypothetical protein